MSEARRVLLHGGAVYSPADPFASAMLVVGAEVAWIGSEGAALAMSDGVDEVVGLDGALVVPAFVDAHLPAAADRRPAARSGIGAVHVVGGPAAPPDSGYGDDPACAGPVVDADDPDLLEVLRDASAQGRQAVVVAADAGAVGRAAGSGAPPGHRLHATGAVAEQDVAAIARSGLLLVLTGRPDLPYAALAAAGVPFAFGSGPGATAPADPWATIATAVHEAGPRDRISARAAFAACTRGGWRAAGATGVGTLVPGASAHYTVWRAQELVVAAPDERIAAWSTDPRSGTPGLPDLRSGTAPPVLLRTVVAGEPVFRADG